MRSSSRIRVVRAYLLAGAALLATSGAARGATLSLLLDQPSYHPGDTVTMTLIGDSQGGTDISLFAAILRPDPSVLYDLQLERFAPPSSDGVPWTHGATGAPVCGPNPRECWLINMIHVNVVGPVALPVGVDPALEPFTYAVLTGTAGAPGEYLIEFGTSRFGVGTGIPIPSAGVDDFFGLKIGRAPAATLIINPEPGTAALLALGLGGLAIARRRSTR